jgi:hypothetical protein
MFCETEESNFFYIRDAKINTCKITTILTPESTFARGI